MGYDGLAGAPLCILAAGCHSLGGGGGGLAPPPGSTRGPTIFKRCCRPHYPLH